MRVFELDDLTMIIGGFRASRPLEVGTVRSAEGIEFPHAMAARPRFLSNLSELIAEIHRESSGTAAPPGRS